MKNYREIADSVFARRDEYVIRQRKKKQAITRATASVGSVALVALAGFALFKNDAFRETPPLSDGESTTVTNTPTKSGDTTATTTGTQTAVGTTTPSKTEASNTTAPSKTEPTKTTSTTVPTKLLITAGEPDANCIEVNESGVYKHGVISPLLKETMERYKDTDAVYAVLVAVRYKEKDGYNDAYNAFLASDEMVKLKEQRDLAYAEWMAAENADDYYRTKDAFRSLQREYDKKRTGFQEAHRKAGLDEAVALLSEFSDIDLIPLKDRLKSDMEWSEEFSISCVMRMSESQDYAYAAVLSADEIVELSERIGCMYWLDSYDEDCYIVGMFDD